MTEEQAKANDGTVPMESFHLPGGGVVYGRAVTLERLRALLSGPRVPSEEEVARTIYERVMDGPVVGEKPAWVPGGNSLKQDEARAHAQAVLALFRSRING